ncbi:lysophosphatidic acid receptor 6-like [Parambassis ranga]|uniref:Lysophosphatidic acid receptor 6-like n=1 Tax=Parambassis ranga TaxID=210632 RepID=A0A6P7JJV6_9TELE|nr:lysophosphatidic acid receptor 6-like [Parambassis ranga]
MSNNNTNVTMDSHYAFAIAFGSIIGLGLPLNAVALWILLRHHSLKSSCAIFMVNLAISDLLLVISLPMKVYFYSTGKWELGGWILCTWITMLFRNNIRSSSIFITFISIDRLLAVVYPLRSRHLRTSTNAWKAAAFVWLFVLVLNVPESVGFSRRIKNYTVCFEFPEDKLRIEQITEEEVIAFFLPLLVITLLTINIVSTALVSWTLRKQLNDSAKVSNKVNVMLLFAMNLMMFTVFFVPVSLVKFFPKSRTFLNCLASVNCCFDPVLYYFSFDGFWKKKEEADISLARDVS